MCARKSYVARTHSSIAIPARPVSPYSIETAQRRWAFEQVRVDWILDHGLRGINRMRSVRLLSGDVMMRSTSTTIVPSGRVVPPFQFTVHPCLANFLVSASRPWRKPMTSPTDPSLGGETDADHSKLASAIEHGIFASRWLLAPLYLGLSVSLLLLLFKFAQGMMELAHKTDTDPILQASSAAR